MTILITGGAGFIGTNAALYFGANEKNTIIVLDNLSRVGTKDNLAHLKKILGRRLTFIQEDIADTSAYLPAIKQAQVIIHLAGQTAVTTSLLDPAHDFAVNVEGGVRLLDAVRRNNPKAIVLYASTNKVYGNLEHHRVVQNKRLHRYENRTCPRGVDETERLNFISPYGCSKGTVDQYMLDYHRSFGIRTVVFRQSCIYGPYQLGVEDQGWVAHFSKQLIHSKSITLFGNGYQVRDLLYVEDLVNLYDAAIQHIEKVQGQVFNAGGGPKNSYSLLEVLDILERKIGHAPPLTYAAERLGDQMYFVSNNTKAKKLVGWRPTTSFLKGVDQMILWQQHNLH
jgi:CDP-paratose 2-epimerase